MVNAKSGSHRALPPEAATALGETLRGHRMRAGLSQEALATRSQVSVQMVRRLEAGNANPTLGTLHAISTALDLSWVDLLLEDDR